MRQENHFVYVVAPTIDVGKLLGVDRNLRRQVIDGVCAMAEGVGSSRRLSDPLRESVLKAAGTLQVGDTGGIVLRPFAGGHLAVSGKDGVSVGWEVDQVNRVKRHVQGPKVKRAPSLSDLGIVVPNPLPESTPAPPPSGLPRGPVPGPASPYP